MKRIVLGVILSVISWGLPAQVNLVPDSGFEVQNGVIYDACRSIYNDSFSKFLKFWNGPTDGTPDLYSSNYKFYGILTPPLFTKSQYTQCGIAVNDFKTYYIAPRTGSNFAGCWYAKVHTSGLKYPYYREFIQTELVKVLTKNAKYKIGFSYVLNPLTKQNRDIDFLFTSIQIQNKNLANCYMFPYCTGFKEKFSPQLTFSKFDRFINDTGTWLRKEILYKNKTSGLKWLTIGSFKDELLGEEVYGGEGSYFYLDDVFVYETQCIVAPDTVCFGAKTEMTSNMHGPWVWINNNKVVSNDSIYTFWAKRSGWYYLTTPNGSDSSYLFVKDSAYFDSLKDSSFCSGDSLVLVLPGPDSALHWSDSKRGASRTFRKGGTYSVERRLNGCSYSDTFFLDQKPVPDNPGVDQHEICRSDRVAMQIRLYSPYKYLWLDDLDTSEQKYIKTKGVYRLRTIGDNHCYTDTNLIVPVLCEPEPWIPSAFVPKGVNTKFAPKFLNVKQVEMSIYDRWGELLYQESGESVAWDGSFKGEICPEGIYVYRIRYIGYNGREYSIDGVFGLIW